MLLKDLLLGGRLPRWHELRPPGDEPRRARGRAGSDAAAFPHGAVLLSAHLVPALDLRVDDHEDPLLELRRLYRVSLERYQPFLSCLPGRGRPSGITDRPTIEATIERFHAQHQGAT